MLIVNAIERPPRLLVGCTETTAHSYAGPGAGQGVYVNPEPFTTCIPTLGWGDPAGSPCIHPISLGTDIASRGEVGVSGGGGGDYKHQLRPNIWMFEVGESYRG